MIEQQDQKQLGEKMASLADAPWITVHPEEPRQELRAGAWRQEQKQSPRRGTAYWLAPHGLSSLFLIDPQYHLPRDATSHSCLNPRASSINQENVLGTNLQASLTDTFSQLRTPLPRLSRFVSS